MCDGSKNFGFLRLGHSPFFMKKIKYISINSVLYSEILSLGGDSAVACYVLLKNRREQNGKIFKEGNRSIYHTLKEKTNLSITTLKRYIKVFIELEVCFFDSAGNFSFSGGNKINKKYKKKKAVRINIGTFQETKLFSFKVRVYSMERQQKKRIDRRHEQNRLKQREVKKFKLSAKEIKFKKSLNDVDYKYSLSDNFTAKTVLSNQGFSKLKFGETKSKCTGYYWKKKLVKAGIIKVRRKFKYMRKCSYKEYRDLKFSVDISLVYMSGRLFKELIPEFTTSDFYEEDREYKKKSYLQEDFLFHLKNLK